MKRTHSQVYPASTSGRPLWKGISLGIDLIMTPNGKWTKDQYNLWFVIAKINVSIEALFRIMVKPSMLRDYAVASICGFATDIVEVIQSIYENNIPAKDPNRRSVDQWPVTGSMTSPLLMKGLPWNPLRHRRCYRQEKQYWRLNKWANQEHLQMLSVKSLLSMAKHRNLEEDILFSNLKQHSHDTVGVDFHRLLNSDEEYTHNWIKSSMDDFHSLFNETFFSEVHRGSSNVSARITGIHFLDFIVCFSGNVSVIFRSYLCREALCSYTLWLRSRNPWQSVSRYSVARRR